jgi:hypothetical protein
MLPLPENNLCGCRNCQGDHNDNSFVILLNAIDCNCIKCKLLIQLRDKARHKKLESFIREVVETRN